QASEDLEAKRQQIQKEIEALEQTLGVDAALVAGLTGTIMFVRETITHDLLLSDDEDSDEELDLPQDVETCLQMNLVYQEVLKEKLADLERLLSENRQQQKEIEAQLSGPVSAFPGLPHMKLYLGTFMKPYFKDKLTGLGPPANEETKERLSYGTRPCDEMKIRRWEAWQKTLLINSVVSDTMKRMLQPKMSKLDYLTAKMSKAEDVDKETLKKQIVFLEKEIEEIRLLSFTEQLYGNRHDDHDWDKIANIDFEGLRQPEDLERFWQNYLHPSINKSTWKQDEIEKLSAVAEQFKFCHWDQIAEALGTNRTAFMCFQTYQRYIAKNFRKREWTKEEDQVLCDLVQKMRIGNFLPYTQISYFMEGRDHAQLMYRWTCVLDPSIKKGPWSKEEDQLLLKAVEKYGPKDWWKIRLEVPGRTDNACRDRYLDCLRDDVKRGAWSDDEVELLKKLVEKYGVGKWAKIATEIPNRIDSQCLNKWKWIVRTTKQGIKREIKGSTKSKSKKRKVTKKMIKEESEMDSNSEDEKIKVEYIDSDGEEKGCNIPSEDETDPREEYIQPDMKEWIPVDGKEKMHPKATVRTMLVRLPTREERQTSGMNSTDDRDTGCHYIQNHMLARSTMLDHLGYPIKMYMGIESQPLDKWVTKWYPSVRTRTVAMLLAQKEQGEKNCFKATQLPDPKQPPPTPQTSKLPIPTTPQQNKKPTSLAPQIYTNIHQGVLTPQPVGPAFLPLLQSDTQGTSHTLQPLLQLVVPVEPGKSVELAAPPTSSISSPSSVVAPTENAEKTRTSKRKCKPTMKAQALKENVKSKACRKRSAKNNQNGGDAPTVAVLPQTTAWILTSAGLMPIQLSSPGIVGNQNKVIPNSVPHFLLQPPVAVKQNQLVRAVGPSNPTTVTPADVASPTARPNLNQILPPSTVSNSPNVSSLSAVNNVPNISSAVTNKSVPLVPPYTTNVPTSVTASAVQVPPPEIQCNQNQNISNVVPQVPFQSPIILSPSNTVRPVSPFNSSPSPVANGARLTSYPVGTSQNFTSNATKVSLTPSVHNVVSVSTASTVTSAPVIPPVHPFPALNISRTTTSNPSPRPGTLSFDFSLMFHEGSAQGKNWIQGNDGISLAQLEKKMPYLPPFVSSISKLVSLLKAKESFLQGAVQLLPEEERAKSEEEAKVAAIRKLVSERFKNNPAYSLLKARFLSCFTLPALLATIHPCKENRLPGSAMLSDDEEDNKDEVKLMQGGNEDQPAVSCALIWSLLQEWREVHTGGLYP
uniref:snRNA-activating protein complex subunit 4 n=1 Tax=Pygocentrus nattereri TaxID=42514 RepID=A0AAR2J3T3_PYGNA